MFQGILIFTLLLKSYVTVLCELVEATEKCACQAYFFYIYIFFQI